MTDFEHVRYDAPDADGIARITLARPDKLNAFTNRMQRELCAAFDLVDADGDVRAVVVTGEGRAFCAGADLSAGEKTFEGGKHAERSGGRDAGGIVALRIYDCTKPVIAAINGLAFGVGVTMTLPMDARFATPDATFGFVFARLGIVPEACSSWFLPRLVGIPTALAWTMGAQRVPAADALAAGLVQHLADDPVSAATEYARDLTRHSSGVSVALTRHLIWRMAAAPSPWDAHRVDSRLMRTLARGEDAREGVRARVDKRDPQFPLRVPDDLPHDLYPWWDREEWSQ